MALFGTVSDWASLTLGLLWAASIVAVARDARSRVSNTNATRLAVAAAALLPFAGAAIWWCARPAQTRAERREYRLRLLVAERELEAVTDRSMSERRLAPVAPALSPERTPLRAAVSS